MIILSIIFFAISFLIYLKLSKNKLLYPDIYLLFIYYTIIPTIFGVLIISYLSSEEYMSFGLGNFISDKTKSEIANYYFISWSFIFILLGILYRFIKLPVSKYQDININRYIFYSGTVFLIIEFVMMSEYPLLKLFLEGAESAAISRGNLINYQIDNGIPLFNLLLRSMPTISLIWLLKKWLIEGKNK